MPDAPDPLAPAREALDIARLAASRGYPRSAISRAYYAAFHAARAAVRSEGSDPKTHRGVASEFSRLFVKAGRVERGLGRVLRGLEERRLEADYGEDEAHGAAAGVAIERAAVLVDAVADALGVPGSGASLADGVPDLAGLSAAERRALVVRLRREMDEAAEQLEFEKADELRGSIAQIEASLAA